MDFIYINMGRGAKSDQDKTTVAKLHQERLEQIFKDEEELPDLREQLQHMKDELDTEETKANIVRYKDLQGVIEELEEHIKYIEQARLDYFKTSGPLLNQYMELDRRPRKIHGLDILQKKREFKSGSSEKTRCYRALRSKIDNSYVYFDEDTINDENYCFDCKAFRISISDEAVMVCPKCSSQTTITCKSSHPSLNEQPTEGKVYEYQRFSHFCHRLANIQGKESFVVPDCVIETVKKEIRRERKDQNLDDLDEDDIQRYLKKYRKLRYDKYYDHKFQILYRVTGREPVHMTPEQEHNLELMFTAIQEPFELFKDSRNNFSSYEYIIFKFCQLLGYDEFLSKLKLHKNENIIYAHDQIWKKICKYMGGEEKGWIFIKSYDY